MAEAGGASAGKGKLSKEAAQRNYKSILSNAAPDEAGALVTKVLIHQSQT